MVWLRARDEAAAVAISGVSSNAIHYLSAMSPSILNCTAELGSPMFTRTVEPWTQTFRSPIASPSAGSTRTDISKSSFTFQSSPNMPGKHYHWSIWSASWGFSPNIAYRSDLIWAIVRKTIMPKCKSLQDLGDWSGKYVEWSLAGRTMSSEVCDNVSGER